MFNSNSFDTNPHKTLSLRTIEKNGIEGVEGLNHAGNINLCLSREANKLLIKDLDTNKITIVDIANEIILLSAVGADGLNGIAIHGERGKDGYIGEDGTEYRYATDGENGTDGQDGRATDGQDGGNGGNVTIHVNAKDTDLLLIFKIKNNCGVGGSGVTAFGGRGGTGGRGGKAYYLTQVIETRDDEAGRKEKLEQVPHGPDGRNGYNGKDGKNYTSRDGKCGKDGVTQIIVHEANTQKIYSGLGHICIDSFNVRDVAGYGLFEPGANIVISNINVSNDGDMPVFCNSPVKVVIGKSRVFEGYAVNRDLLIPPIYSKSSFKFETDCLVAKISDINLQGLSQDNKTRYVKANLSEYVKHEQLSLAIFFSGLNKKFEGNKHARIKTEFPVRISNLSYCGNVPAGSGTKICFKIENKSLRDLGLNSEAQRKIIASISFKVGPHYIGSSDCSFYDEHGNKRNIEELISFEIKKLDAKKTIKINGTIIFSKLLLNTIQKLQGKLILSLDRINSNEHRIIQTQDFTISISREKYKKTQGSKYLLVTNSSNSNKTVEMWKDFAVKENEKMDIWDVCTEGHFNLFTSTSNGNSTLSDFRNGTIIILDGSFDLNGKNYASSTELLRARDFHAAILKYNIRVLIIDGKSKDDYYKHFGEKSKEDYYKYFRVSFLHYYGINYENLGEIKIRETKAIIQSGNTDNNLKNYTSFLLSTSFEQRIKMYQDKLFFSKNSADTKAKILLNTILYDLKEEHLNWRETNLEVLKNEFHTPKLDLFLSQISLHFKHLDRDSQKIHFEFLVSLNALTKEHLGFFQKILFFREENIRIRYINSKYCEKIEATVLSIFDNSEAALEHFKKLVTNFSISASKNLISSLMTEHSPLIPPTDITINNYYGISRPIHESLYQKREEEIEREFHRSKVIHSDLVIEKPHNH